ncbi:transposase for insertion sequence element IS1086 [Waddlia chondrophila 2032/99]|uniref:Transposase n=2 Tax=Waddlia chondrophila TaxID=71667 RepID=D6YVJ3_WADCW|nr:IS30 family transposase [Waddlia chondrophila]ADI38154.1 transposase [Waddlia chondrophila WSU 86-1044]CCB91153.1 transposase for insertion sequence element IS1086 [Waddlia chondrophila 2032/99]
MAQYCRLSFAERCRIEQLKKQGYGVRSISRSLCRSPSTISDELHRRFTDYKAKTAQQDAIKKSCQRVKKRKISGFLEEAILYLLTELRCSPEQISGYLRKDYASMPEMQVSPEAIYLWIYRHERREVITGFLRRKHRYRRNRNVKGVHRGGIKNRVSIRERPGSVEDRQEVGHWEGDLIIGKKQGSAVGTLVERSSRYTILVQLDGRDSETVVSKFISFLKRIPAHLRRSLTYDNGSEMAYHEKIYEQVGTKVYFADPRSPWQRGSNENTNGLIREFLPKSTDLSVHSQEKLGGIASLLNRRPRKILNFNSPEKVFEYCWENESAKLSKCLIDLE